MLKTISVAVLSLASFAAVGCQSDNGSSAAARKSRMRSPDASVVCDKCGPVAKVPVIGDKNRPIPGKYRTPNVKVCPECAAAAEEALATGATKTCDACGGHLTVVEAPKK